MFVYPLTIECNQTKWISTKTSSWRSKDIHNINFTCERNHSKSHEYRIYFRRCSSNLTSDCISFIGLHNYRWHGPRERSTKTENHLSFINFISQKISRSHHNAEADLFRSPWNHELLMNCTHIPIGLTSSSPSSSTFAQSIKIIFFSV